MKYAIVNTMEEAETLNQLIKTKYYELVNNANFVVWSDITKHKDQELYALSWWDGMKVEDVPFSFEFAGNLDGWVEIEDNL